MKLFGFQKKTSRFLKIYFSTNQDYLNAKKIFSSSRYQQRFKADIIYYYELLEDKPNIYNISDEKRK